MTSFAQIEVKLNPLGLLFGSPDVSVEYGVNDNFGVEAGLSAEFGKIGITTAGSEDYQLSKSGLGFFAAGKYYFSPDEGFDRFGVGLYLRGKNFKTTAKADDAFTYKRSVIGAGLMLQYKWVGAAGILFEIDAGAGKAVVDKFTWDDANYNGISPTLGLDGFFRLNLGYRFGGE